MSIYSSDATSSTFSIIANNQQPLPSKRGRSGRSKSSSLIAPMGISDPETDPGINPENVPDVVGLSRLDAIDALIAAGFDYMISYVTSGASYYNNDKISSQSINDNVVVINVFQYVEPEPPSATLLGPSINWGLTVSALSEGHPQFLTHNSFSFRFDDIAFDGDNYGGSMAVGKKIYISGSVPPVGLPRCCVSHMGTYTVSGGVNINSKMGFEGTVLKADLELGTHYSLTSSGGSGRARLIA